MGHAEQDWIGLVSLFDGNRVMPFVEGLTQPGMAGRQAGTAGADRAAAYIAGAFAEFGLQPAGDGTDSGYMQSFPFTMTIRSAEPSLSMDDDEFPYLYREEFLSLRSSVGHEDPVNGELVWVGVDAPADANLRAQIMVSLDSGDIENLMARAINFDADGLIVLGTKKEDDELFAKRPLTDQSVSEIPAVELTLDGTLRFLEKIDLRYDELEKLDPVHPLGFTGQVSSPVSGQQQAWTANVLGLLPGSDPFLAQEVIVLGAHYDHVGDDHGTDGCLEANQAPCVPGSGTRYSGANDNASGVATMLEIARFWREQGYRPRRSILFAAWGAQELGQLGSTYFVHTPSLPLTNVVGLLQLDGVGGGEGFKLGIQGDAGDDTYLLHTLRVASLLLNEDVVETEQVGESDHLAFDEAGLPSTLMSWRLANEHNLPDELANGVRPERLSIAGRVAALAFMMLAR
jgi:hypothetical protein